MLGGCHANARLELKSAARHHGDLLRGFASAGQNAVDEQLPVAGFGRAMTDHARHAGVMICEQRDLARRIKAVEIERDVAPGGHAHEASGVRENRDARPVRLAACLDPDFGCRQ